MKSSFLPFKLISFASLLFAGFLLAQPVKSTAMDIGSQNQIAMIKVQGVVTDQSGNPLPGVTIMEKGTQNGTISTEDGSYAITVHDGATLVFKTLGMAPTTVKVDGRHQIDVTLKGNTVKLNEVVAIGYGKQSRVDVTNAISKVGEQEFEHTSGGNALKQLQGKVPGLTLQISNGQPGADPQIFLRGGTSTSPEGDAPLLIVDGVVSQGMRSITDLDPGNIESIQVLKDAASTAIYGARAANGIIIVTTKSGKSGKTKVNFKFTYGIDQQPKRYSFTSAEQYVYVARLNTMEFNKTNPDLYLTGGTFGMSTGNPRNTAGTLEFLDTYIKDYGPGYVNDLLKNQGWQTMKDPATGKQLIFKGTDYQDVTFQTAPRKDYNVNVSGGNDKGTYYMGLGYTDQDGIVLGSYYKDYSILLNTTYKLSNRFKLNAHVNYSLRNANSPNSYQNVLSRSVKMPPTYRLRFEDGLPAPGEGVSSFVSRLYEVYYREKYTDINVYRTTLHLGADWDIAKGLKFTPSVSWFTAEGKENYFQAYNTTNKKRNASAAHNLDTHLQTDGLLNYQKTLAGKHHFNLMLGTSFIKDYAFNMSGSGYDAPTDYITTLNATSATTQRASTTESTNVLMSYFGRLNYDYNKKYLFSASLRRDGSSLFAKNHKWGLFPGVSAGWNIYMENFWDAIRPIVSQFKLRASWGQAGNNVLSIYDSQGQYSTGYNYLGEVGILNTTLANNDLIWETTTSFDIGADIGLFNNKITLLLDYYNKLTSDRLFDKPLAAQTGFSSIKSNYGSIRNTGFEVELGATPVKSKDFSWNLDFTFSYNKGVVNKLPPNGEAKNRVGGNYVYDPHQKKYVKVGGFAEGEQFGQRWAYDMIGVYSTDQAAANAPYDVAAAGRKKIGGDAIWKDLDHNDTIDNRDMVFMGYIRPDIQGGMVNTFHYKNLSLRIVMDYATGFVIDNGFRARTDGSARNNMQTLTDVIGDQIWKKQGDVNKKYPRYTVQSDVDYNWHNYLRPSNGIGNGGYASNSSLFYSKGDFIAFREVSLGYHIQTKVLQKAYIQSIDLFAGVFNLGYLTKYDGLMPEVYTGRDPGLYPRPREYNFSINVNF
ncbi:MAG TPA: SusC/RagA family TonB-linked outer membrane protein [Chitinophagaceae bacterium]|nr:SusC/RagA family TonB-linked outer membrane protein [Chitinophagaceae bacterium]